MEIDVLLEQAQVMKLKRTLTIALNQVEIVLGHLGLYMDQDVVDRMREEHLKEIEKSLLGE